MALAIPRLQRERHLSRDEATAMLARWADHYEATHTAAPLFGREVPRGALAGGKGPAVALVPTSLSRPAGSLGAALPRRRAPA